MARRARKRQTQGQASPQTHRANHCRALVRVDGAGIRKKIKKDYEKAVRDLENARRQFDQYHQSDLPQFTRWLNSHFGALLTELRELSRQMAADEQLVFEVEHEVLFSGGSYARAYRRVLERREHPEPPPPPPPNDEQDGERDEYDGRPESGNDGDEEDPLEALFNAIFGEPDPDEEPREAHGPGAGRRARSAGPVLASARLKNLYRAVVRRLHPDSQREMTAQKTEWWHQAQAAYEAGDAEQLEVILTLCEIGDSGTTAHTSASLLQRIIAQLKGSLRGLKRQLAGLRREPAWSFSRRADHEALMIQVRRELLDNLKRLRYEAQQLAEMIGRWKAAAERPKPARGRKPQPLHPEFQF